VFFSLMFLLFGGIGLGIQYDNKIVKSNSFTNTQHDVEYFPRKQYRKKSKRKPYRKNYKKK